VELTSIPNLSLLERLATVTTDGLRDDVRSEARAASSEFGKWGDEDRVV
jgi:hypothetical protein